jgi:hypothetical protein
MKVYVAEAHAHVQRLISVVKMATMLVCTTEEQGSLLRFLCVQKDLMQSIFIKKWFLFTVGSTGRIKRFSLGGKNFIDDEEVETEVREWVRQQSKTSVFRDFDAIVKRWDKCINVMSRNKCFFQGRTHIFCVL